ncbi:hypothetical protein NL676_011626 [Syzygium grande]|nr:hypothetical protein NL676_011626 [Syzygium grande]
MKKQVCSNIFILIVLFLGSNHLGVEAQPCKPSGRFRGRKPPPKQCNLKIISNAAKKAASTQPTGARLPFPIKPKTHKLSTALKKAVMAVGDPSVIRSTIRIVLWWWLCRQGGWTTSTGASKILLSTLTEEVSRPWLWMRMTTKGCDPARDYQPPCPSNIVDASKAVWKALGVPSHDWGELDIYWSDE